MTVEDAKKAFDQLKAQGNSDEDILGVLYTMFQDDAINFDELESFAKILGYEITDEFRNMSPEDQKTKGYEQAEGAEEGVSKDEIEDAKETDAGSGAEDTGADKAEGAEADTESSDNNSDDEEEATDNNSEKADEDDDKKAAKLFGFGNKQ